MSWTAGRAGVVGVRLVGVAGVRGTVVCAGGWAGAGAVVGGVAVGGYFGVNTAVVSSRCQAEQWWVRAASSAAARSR